MRLAMVILASAFIGAGCDSFRVFLGVLILSIIALAELDTLNERFRE